MEVIPGIYQLVVPMPASPLGSINAYLIKSKGESMLVDTGWNTDEAFGALARQMGEVDVALCDLSYIAITHVHPDHFGLVGRLKPHTSARLVIHEIERSFLQSRYVQYDALLEEMDQWLRINGVPELQRPDMNNASLGILGLVSVVMPDYPVRGGEHIKVGDFDFEVIWTPGHSPGHICLFEQTSGVLISGDHVLPGITPNVSMHAQTTANPLVDYLDSLLEVEELPVKLILPSHRGVFTDLPKRAEEIRAHHRERQQHIVDALKIGLKTAYEVAAAIPWSTKGVPFEDLSAHPKRAAVMETLAHLELLRATGVLTRRAKDGLVRYGLVRSEAVDKGA